MTGKVIVGSLGDDIQRIDRKNEGTFNKETRNLKGGTKGDRLRETFPSGLRWWRRYLGSIIRVTLIREREKTLVCWF